MCMFWSLCHHCLYVWIIHSLCYHCLYVHMQTIVPLLSIFSLLYCHCLYVQIVILPLSVCSDIVQPLYVQIVVLPLSVCSDRCSTTARESIKTTAALQGRWWHLWGRLHWGEATRAGAVYQQVSDVYQQVMDVHQQTQNVHQQAQHVHQVIFNHKTMMFIKR